MRQFALSDAARVNLNSELPHHKSRQRFAAATAFVVTPLGAAERSHLIPFVALIGKLRLAQQELPPGERLKLHLNPYESMESYKSAYKRPLLVEINPPGE